MEMNRISMNNKTLFRAICLAIIDSFFQIHRTHTHNIIQTQYNKWHIAHEHFTGKQQQQQIYLSQFMLFPTIRSKHMN